MNSNTEKDKATYQGDYNADKFGTPTAPSAPATNPNSPVNYEGGTAAYNADKFGTPSGGFQGIANNFSSGMSSYVENGTSMQKLSAPTPAPSPAPAPTGKPWDTLEGGYAQYYYDKHGEWPTVDENGNPYPTESGEVTAPGEGEPPAEGELPTEGELPSEETVVENETVTESGEVVDPVEVEIQKEVEATIDTGKLTFDEWKATYGADTETDFQNAKAQLEYEMATWAANYGANAEKLYQMGLSNSGVSDIFGANAYAAYVGAMNQLYLEKIRLDRENIDLYEQYSNKYEADLASKTETRNKNITNAYAYGLGIYDGSNLDAVKTMMLNAGYEADVVDEAVARLAAVDPSMIPTLREQQATSDTKVSTAYNGYKGSYHPGMKGTIEADLKAQNFSADEIARVIGQLDDYYNNLPEEQRPDVIAKANADASFEERVVSGYSSVLSKGNYNGENGDDVKIQLTNLGYTEEEAAEIVARLDKLDKSLFKNQDVMDAYNLLIESIPDFTGSAEQRTHFEQLMATNNITDEDVISKAWGLALTGMLANETEAGDDKIVAMFNEIISGENGWSASQEAALRQQLGVNKWTEDEINTLVGYLNDYANVQSETVKAETETVVSDAVNNDINNLNAVVSGSPESVVISDLAQAFKDYKLAHAKGEISDADFEAYAKATGSAAISTFKWALEAKPDGTAERLLDASVLEQLNIDPAELEGLSESEQAAYVEQEIMDKAAELHKSGMISSEEYIAFVKDDWLKSELEKIIADDSKAGNLKAIGLRDAGAVVADIMSWKDNGAMNEDEYQELLGYVVDTMKFKLNDKGQISWYDTVKGAEATVKAQPGARVYDEKLLNALSVATETVKEYNQTIALNDGKLYVLHQISGQIAPVWSEVSGLRISGDGVSNSEAQKAGIYEILVYLLTPAKGEVGSSNVSLSGSNINPNYSTK